MRKGRGGLLDLFSFYKVGCTMQVGVHLRKKGIRLLGERESIALACLSTMHCNVHIVHASPNVCFKTVFTLLCVGKQFVPL